MRIILLFVAVTAFAQNVGSPVAITPYQLLDARSGQAIACSGCAIWTYAAGTTTKVATFTDASLTTPNTNPVLTNSSGYAVNGSTITGIWVGGTSSCLKLVAKDANGATIFSQDHVCDFAGSLAEVLANAATLYPYVLSAGYSTFSDFCAGAVTAGKTMLIAQAWNTVPTQTCAASVEFVAGGLLQPGSGQTVTLGKPTCPTYQACFDGGAGTVAFTSLPDNLNPAQWGAQALGVAGAAQDVYFQAASNAVNASGGGTLHVFPAALPYALNVGTQIYSNMTVNIHAGASVSRVNSQTGGCPNFGCLSTFYSALNANPSNIHIIGPGVLDGNRAGNAGVGAGAAATGIAAMGWKNSSIENITIQNEASDGIITWCSGPSIATYNSSNTNCGDNILIDHVFVTNSARNDITNEGGTRVTISNSHLSYANGASPQACFDVEPDFAGQFVTGFTVVNTEWDHCSGPNASQMYLTAQSELKAAFNINGYAHDNESSTNSLAIIVPASLAVSLANIVVTGNYFGTVPNGFVIDYEGTGSLSNITVAANTTGPVGVGCSIGGGSTVTNLVLAGGVANGSTNDFGNNGCQVSGAVTMAFAHNNNLASLTSTASSIAVSDCVNTAAAGCVNVTSTDPTVRLNVTGGASIADKRRGEFRVVSNSASPISGIELVKYSDAGSATTLGWIFMDGGWLATTSVPSSDAASPGAGFIVGKNGLGLLGAGGPTWTAGAGAPSGSCPNGSLYTNTTGSAGSTLYSCVASGWVAFTSH